MMASHTFQVKHMNRNHYDSDKSDEEQAQNYSWASEISLNLALSNVSSRNLGRFLDHSLGEFGVDQLLEADVASLGPGNFGPVAQTTRSLTRSFFRLQKYFCTFYILSVNIPSHFQPLLELDDQLPNHGGFVYSLIPKLLMPYLIEDLHRRSPAATATFSIADRVAGHPETPIRTTSRDRSFVWNIASTLDIEERSTAHTEVCKNAGVDSTRDRVGHDCVRGWKKNE
ncbi:uncharacterized protein CC84DRAFT_1206144 [Paraphaeosphaeria sporulosa]|uniref:Uncharacterized protein n=1 Tax=Paraphaeosphaeria sporulosa TaxID=1460663 RepID=A0A177CCG7_9PLEO|nr:uncharacterized protein CC84DRAFT_1206144 [Paraphaeosphaeria sporulosa]OAG04468.1 hypothetical protein CC84DRAFT_1206144 [Paraphaeosphaeria sporulosa]